MAWHTSPVYILVVAITTALSITNMAESCIPCSVYFDQLRNKTQGSCRCIYYDVYSKDYPQSIADCMNLQRIPEFNRICNVTDIYSLIFPNNQIKEIDSHAFKSLKMSDEVLNWAGARPEVILYRNNIEYIHREAFKGAMETKLTLLDLRYNKLKTIPEAVFTLQNLTKLYLKANEIGFASGDPKLSKLTVIDLTSNNLKTFSRSLCSFPSLQYLYLDGNPIQEDLSEFLDTLKECNHLRELTWPQETATCDQLALETYANTSTCKIMVVRHGSNELVICDSDSSPEYKGISFEWALRTELSKVCTMISSAASFRQDLFVFLVIVTVGVIQKYILI